MHYKLCFVAGDATHLITAEEYADLGVADFRKLWREIVTFINAEKTPIFPPLYCMVRSSFLVGFTSRLLVNVSASSINFDPL